MIKMLAGQDALATFTFLRDKAGLSVTDAAEIMQRAWLRGESRRGPLVLSLASLNSDGAENASYSIGVHLPGRGSRL